jgi:hypothetical protein
MQLTLKMVEETRVILTTCLLDNDYQFCLKYLHMQQAKYQYILQ